MYPHPFGQGVTLNTKTFKVFIKDSHFTVIVVVSVPVVVIVVVVVFVKARSLCPQPCSQVCFAGFSLAKDSTMTTKTTMKTRIVPPAVSAHWGPVARGGRCRFEAVGSVFLPDGDKSLGFQELEVGISFGNSQKQFQLFQSRKESV